MRTFNDDLRAAAREALDDGIRLVYGEGPKRPTLMLIGEAPGEQEERQGRPFVGKAGRILDEFLDMVRLKREDIYITNVVKHRPTRVSPAGNLINRPPNREELRFFIPWLEREIDLVQPAIVATLGNVPLKALLGKTATIGEKHGRLIEEENRSIFPLYHPASLIYDPSRHAVYEADVKTLAELCAAK